MNDVTTHQIADGNSEMELEIKTWIQTGTIFTRQELEDKQRRREFDANVAHLDPDEEIQRRADFDENFRRMQSDYRDKTSSAQPVIIRTVSKWKFWKFWK